MGGQDKGWVTWQGRPLVQHVLDRLLPQVDTVIISANRNLERYRGLGYPVVADDHAGHGEFAGPLAGMLAGLERADTPWVVCVPCDAPALPTDLVARLLASAGSGTAKVPALAVSAGHRQPVFCLLPRTIAPQLAQALSAGEHRPTVFLENAGAREVPFDDASAFANINATASGAGPEGSTHG
jgi:molybdopterin-guanine dinucleotide biosynthesis protein A